MEMIARKWKKWKRKVTQKDSLDYLSNSMSHLFENVPTTKECFQTNTHIRTHTHTYTQKHTNSEREANNIANCPLEVKIWGAL